MAFAVASLRPYQPANLRLLHAGAFLSLFCVGLYITSFGPAMPFLARDLGVSLGTTGLLLTLLFAGSIAASGAVAARLHIVDARLLGLAGLALVVAGLAALAVAPGWELTLAGGLVLGAGDGLVVASTHSIMATTSEDPPRAITRLNLFFALGAVLGPLWAGTVLELSGGRGVVFGGIAVVPAVAAAIMLVSPGASPAAADTPAAAARLPITLTAWIMAAVLFLYVGAEIGLGSWVSSYSREAAGAGVMAGAVVTSGYWGALALGRLLTGALLSRGHDAGLVLLAAVAGAGLASLVLALSGGELAVAAAAAFATGLCFGPVWPMAMGIGSAGGRSSAPAALVTVGNAGGVLFPWLQGLTLASAGPDEGIAMTAALCAAMLLLAGLALTRRRH